MVDEQKENEKEYYPIIKQYLTITIVSVFLGKSVPPRYDNNPECFIYVLLLTLILLGIWGSSLGNFIFFLIFFFFSSFSWYFLIRYNWN